MTEDHLSGLIREASPDLQRDFSQRMQEIGRKGMAAAAVAVVSGLGILWLAPWWGKLFVPLGWGLFYMLTQQIAAAFETHLVVTRRAG
jgi:hypothetical protein